MWYDNTVRRCSTTIRYGDTVRRCGTTMWYDDAVRRCGMTTRYDDAVRRCGRGAMNPSIYTVFLTEVVGGKRPRKSIPKVVVVVLQICNVQFKLYLRFENDLHVTISSQNGPIGL